MIGIIFSALFLGFFTGRFFLTPTAKPLLDTILMTALAVMVFCAGADIAAAVRLYAAFLRLGLWAYPFLSFWQRMWAVLAVD